MTFWDKTAADYDWRHTAPRTKYLRARELWLLQRFAFGKIADLGCGTGWPAIELERIGLPVYGFDSSRAMLELFRAKSQDAKLCLADCRALPIKPGKFDCVVSTLSMLNYCERWQRAIEQLALILKPGGRAILSVVSDIGQRRTSMRVHGHKTAVLGIGLAELKQQFERNGLELVYAEGLFLFTNPNWSSFRPIGLVERLCLWLERLFAKSLLGRAKILLLVFDKKRKKEV
jgi:SAM-dependent methyltransferase